MATEKSTIVQNENWLTHKGKGTNDIKANVLKPTKQGRIALKDISKDGKTVLSGAAKAPTLKQKSVLHAPESKTESKSYHLTDEELKQCREWAKEGIEEMHFSGTDSHKQQQEINEERIKKKVEKVLTSLREWIDISYRVPVPVEEFDNDSDDLRVMELMPEELPPWIDEEEDKEFEDKESEDEESEDELRERAFMLRDYPLELKLRDEDDE